MKPRETCTACTKHHTKCDKRIPCENCVRRGTTCEGEGTNRLPRRLRAKDNSDLTLSQSTSAAVKDYAVGDAYSDPASDRSGLSARGDTRITLPTRNCSIPPLPENYLGTASPDPDIFAFTTPPTSQPSTAVAALQCQVPGLKQMWYLVNYHETHLLWHHGSYDGPNFRQGLEKAVRQHTLDGTLQIQSMSLQWIPS